MFVQDLGRMAYRQAWALQEAAHAKVVAGGEEQLLLVEHPPVITLGRRPGGEKNLIAPQEILDRLGVELVQSDRGGGMSRYRGADSRTDRNLYDIDPHFDDQTGWESFAFVGGPGAG